MRELCMRQVPPGLCIADNLYKEVRFTPPGPRASPLSHQRIWMWLNSDTGETVGALACMIDVEFVTLGIIRCNIGDSMKCKIAFERVGGNRKVFDSSWCFMVSCWSFFS